MTEELKYKVGDELVLKVVVDSIDGTVTPYHLRTLDGRFVCRISKESLEKSLVNLPPKPKVPQAVMDWYDENKDERVDWTLRQWLSDSFLPEEVSYWLYGDNHLDHQHAIATLIAYGPEAVEVEKEKRYKVKLKASDQRLIMDSGKPIFTSFFSGWAFTKQRLIDAGFGDVFDNPMFEVEEVE